MRTAETSTIIDPRWHVFLRVVATGSLSKAAVSLDMPQSMVSRNIAQLEQQCGERLFRRTGRGVELTEVGELLLPRITALVADADALADDVRSVRGLPVGEVRVGMLPSAVDQFAGALYAAVLAEMPGVRLHLSESASAQLEEHLREGRLDMAIVLREDEASVGDAQLLARLPLQLVGRRGEPLVANGDVALAALSGVPLVVPGRPHLLRGRLDRLCADHGLQLNVAAEVDSVRLQFEVVAAGGGYAIAIVPATGLDPRLAAARIVPELDRFVVLADTPRRPGTRATRAVRQLIVRLAGGT